MDIKSDFEGTAVSTRALSSRRPSVVPGNLAVMSGLSYHNQGDSKGVRHVKWAMRAFAIAFSIAFVVCLAVTIPVLIRNEQNVYRTMINDRYREEPLEVQRFVEFISRELKILAQTAAVVGLTSWDRGKWESIAAPMYSLPLSTKYFDAIASYGLAARVEYDEIPVFEENINSEYSTTAFGGTLFVRDRNGTRLGTLPPRINPPSYFPFAFVFPYSESVPLIGFDFAATTIESDAIKEAENDGEVSAARAIQCGSVLESLIAPVFGTNGTLDAIAVATILVNVIVERTLSSLSVDETLVCLFEHYQPPGLNLSILPIYSSGVKEVVANSQEFLIAYPNGICPPPIIISTNSSLSWEFCFQSESSAPITFSTFGVAVLVEFAVFLAIGGLVSFLFLRAVQLFRYQEQKDQFLADVSHELRTPLTSVVLASHLLISSEKIAEEDRNTASLVNSSAKSLLVLIGDLLDISRLRAGQSLSVQMNPVRVDVGPVRNAMRMTELLAREESVAVTFQAEKHLWVVGDEIRLTQACCNIISNAIKMSTGHSSVEVTVSSEMQSGNEFVRIDVQDHGRGMTLAEREILFQRFSQLDGPASKIQRGSGLGLVITHAILEQMHGELRMESAGLGCGTLVSILLPAGEEPEGYVTPMPSASSSSASLHASMSPRVKAQVRVLLVDDTRVNLMLTQRVLQREGAEVVVADCGESALLRCQDSGPFDLVLCDVLMPGLSGPETVKIIRSQELVKPDVTIYALTASSSEVVEAECRAAGMNDVIVKPVTSERLRCILTLL